MALRNMKEIEDEIPVAQKRAEKQRKGQEQWRKSVYSGQWRNPIPYCQGTWRDWHVELARMRDRTAPEYHEYLLEQRLGKDGLKFPRFCRD